MLRGPSALVRFSCWIGIKPAQDAAFPEFAEDCTQQCQANFASLGPESADAHVEVLMHATPDVLTRNDNRSIGLGNRSEPPTGEFMQVCDVCRQLGVSVLVQ